MKLFTKLFILSAAVTALSGCRSDLLDTVPYDKAASNSMWTNENFCELGVTGVYHELREDYIAKKAYELEAYCVSGSCRDNDYSILAGTASTGSGLFSDYWKQHYEGIQRANDAISHLAEAPVPDAFKNKLIAEVKILRAFFYYKLNAVFRGVPYYDVPVLITEANKPRSSEIEIWEACVKDLTDAINEPTLPDRIAAGNAQWGRVTKSVAYALRGKVYLWMQDWAKAEADFRQVGNMGHKLFDGGYKQLFKEANEQSDEAIFSLQCIDNNETADGNSMSFRYGGRTTFGSCWNTILASTDFVDTYENIDGSKFNWDDYLPGYSSMEPKDREVFFLRNTDADVLKAELLSLGYEGDIDAAIKGIREKVENRLSKLSTAAQALYLPAGNEARIKKAYESRDPRLQMAVITPYAQYNGASSGIAHTYTLRWPYRGSDSAEPFDIRTDTNDKFYYLWRKFVPEGLEQTERDTYGLDIPLIRYAEVLLLKAEALNEWGSTHESEAIRCVNEVRRRAGHVELNNATYPATKVNGQSDLRERIRNEYYWEIGGEDSMYFHELRWGTWKDKKFDNNRNGLMQMWGETTYTWYWLGDQCWSWPIPAKEMEMNSNLEQNEGWIN